MTFFFVMNLLCQVLLGAIFVFSAEQQNGVVVLCLLRVMMELHTDMNTSHS